MINPYYSLNSKFNASLYLSIGVVIVRNRNLLYNNLIYLEDDGGEDNSISTILGLSLGLGIPALVILIFILRKNKAFEKMKASWDDCMSGIRRRLHNCFHPHSRQQ